MAIRIINADAFDGLRQIEDESVHCVVTSPPYWGLRSYLDADHPDKPREIGQEPTITDHIEVLVRLFREVRRVLRKDGVVWLNYGSSYSAGEGANPLKCLNSLVKGGSIFFGNAASIAVSAHSVHISSDHKRTPKSVFPKFLASQGKTVEDGHENFSKLVDLFTSPSNGGVDLPSRSGSDDGADTEVAVNCKDHLGVISANHNAQPKPELLILGPRGAGPRKDDEATLAINYPNKPSVDLGINWHSVWDTFSVNSTRKGVVNINLVNETIALGYRLDTIAGLVCDFRITQAGEKHVSLVSVCDRVRVTVSDVGHFWVALSDGSIVPYAELYRRAIQLSNELQPKQDLMAPSRLAIALQRDGWILRSSIIWHKPNPMPESVTDRPTNSHEKVFLLTKSPRYFYDAEAVKEASITNDMRRPYGSEGSWQLDGRPAEQRPNGKIRKALSWQERKDAGEPIRRGDPGETGWATPGGNVGEGGLSRNMRNVWTVATQPFSGAHFATFPAELVKRCIKAGSSERGCCSKCGAPWVRNIVRSDEPDPSYKGSKFDAGKTGARDGGERTQNGERFKKVASGWSAGCDCEAGVAPCVVLDPFGGAGTTGLVADRLGRDAILVELNSMYAAMAERRIGKDAPLFASVCVEKVG